MAVSHVIAGTGEHSAQLAVRTVTLADLRNALMKGIDDFSAMPSYALFLCLIYPVAGLVFGRLAIGYDVLPLLFPLMAGFALVGPFAAILVHVEIVVPGHAGTVQAGRGQQQQQER